MDTFDDRNIRTALGDDGVLVATIDMPGRSMNVFSSDLMDSLDRLLDRVAAESDVRSVVVASGKPAFIAGADLEMVRTFTERARHDAPSALHRLCGRLGRIFRRLETGSKPFVAAVQGLALGGGLELALACHHRVLADGAQVGLPEVKLGLLPGAGGTQRLPRLIGRSAALKMMLLGEPQTAGDAVTLGIAHEALPADSLLAGARRRALALADAPAAAPWDRGDWHAPAADAGTAAAHADAYAAEAGISREQRRLYPAHDAILACVLGGWALSMDAACDWEMNRFVELIRDPVAGNMIRSLFLDRQRAAKSLPAASPRRPRAVVRGVHAGAVGELLKAARVEVTDDAADTGAITVLTAGAHSTGPGAVAWLRTAHDAPHSSGASCGVWVSEPTVHGRAAEVTVSGVEAEPSAGLEIARWLRATPLITRGGVLLPRLAAAFAPASLTTDDRQLAVALEAARVWGEGVQFDQGIADSAAVIAGLHPPYTGGPFEFLRQRGAVTIRAAAAAAFARHGAAFAVPEALERLSAAPDGAGG